MSWYGIYDSWHRSPAERARDRCRDVIFEIEDAVLEIREDIVRLRNLVASGSDEFLAAHTGDASTGLFESGFESAVVAWKEHVYSLIGPDGAFAKAADNLEGLLPALRSRKAKLDWMCWHEDERELEYEESEIPR